MSTTHNDMTWITPSDAHPTLSLPKIGPLDQPIVPANCRESISVSPEFIDAWTNGPTDLSAASIHESLCRLISAFSSLAYRVKNSVQKSTKDHQTDYVTETDQGVEMLFRLWIQQHCPDHKIIGEEGGQDAVGSDDVIWYIDPIDGTANYVETPLEETPMVSMHFGSSYNGRPFISIVAYPFHDALYSHFDGMDTTQNPLHPRPLFTADETYRIASEFSGVREHNLAFLRDLCQKEGAEEARYRAIGISLTAQLERHVTLFYKDATKLWDVMAPLGLIQAFRPDLSIECYFNPQEAPLMTAENAVCISPFSNDKRWIDHLNRRHHPDRKGQPTFCRAGTIIVYPTDQPRMRDVMLDTVWAMKDGAS